MSITKTYNRCKQFEKMFRCPVCRTQMAFRNENSLVCVSGHCFDLSRHGYINFSPNQGKNKYTKNLFESRRLVFQAGFYDPLKEVIEDLLRKHSSGFSRINLLDAGCGEGFFSKELLCNSEHETQFFALDLFKDAVVLAAKGNDRAIGIVGDLSNIPLTSGSMEIVTNIFAPANYDEFLRVMNDKGFVVKVVPGKEYLSELRACAQGQLINKEYSNDNVLQFFYKNLVCLEQKHLSYQLPVNESQLAGFVQMTPLLFNVDRDRMRLEEIKQITIDVEIIVGKK